MRSEGSRCYWFSYLKVLLRAAAAGLFVWLLMVGSPEGGEDPGKTTRSRLAAGSSVGVGVGVGSHVKQAKVLANNHPELDLNFMSKVKVPKGPDPIHNRRVGKNGGPPSRA